MRLDVKKFLFMGLEEDRLTFFKQAQEFGIIHFIESSQARIREIPQEISNLSTAIKVLRGLPTMEQESFEEFALADGLAYKILHLSTTLEKFHEQLRLTLLDISRVGVFGDFSKEDIAYIEKEGRVKIQFFFAKHGLIFDPPLPDEVIYVATEHELDYFVAINQNIMQYPKLVEMRIEHPLGELQTHQRALEKQIHDTEQELKKYAKYHTFLNHALINKLNSYNLQTAQNGVQLTIDDQLFVVEGWVPENKVDKLQEINQKLNVHVEEIAIEPEDLVPTYLENHGIERLGEDLVNIYDTPSTTDKDPSLWVLVSFAFFFAFIVGDAGYGLIFLAIALYVNYKHSPKSYAGKRMLKLITILCVSCIAWGLLTTSFFGIPFAYDSPVRKISITSWMASKKMAYHLEHKDDVYEYWVKKFPNLKEVTDPNTFIREASTEQNGRINYELLGKFTDNIMLELALFIGVIHILISLLRYLTRNWVFLGWILFVIGGYIYFPHYLQTTSLIHYVFGLDKEEAWVGGLYLLFGGLSLATIIAIFKNNIIGVLEPMTAIQIFTDVLSYLRLYALGMAGAIFTATINDTTTQINIVFATVLIILGHTINMALAAMGGVIHGLRLNFIEWYHYSFEGGGKKFKPLLKMQIE